jgi:hypothetical protein
MINKYNELRQTFLNGVKELFPNSPDLQIEVTVDNISKQEVEVLNLTKKEQTLFGDLKYLTAYHLSLSDNDFINNEEETIIDNFQSELYK